MIETKKIGKVGADKPSACPTTFYPLDPSSFLPAFDLHITSGPFLVLHLSYPESYRHLSQSENEPHQASSQCGQVE